MTINPRKAVGLELIRMQRWSLAIDAIEISEQPMHAISLRVFEQIPG